jgi:hypothetical protein
MVQPTESWFGQYVSDILNRSRYWRVPVQGQMSARAIVVLHVGEEYVAEVSLTVYDDVIKALPSSDRPDQPFGISILPRRSRRDGPVANAHGANSPFERPAVDAVAIADEIAGGGHLAGPYGPIGPA